MSIEQIQLTKNDSLPSIQYTISRSGSNSTTPNLEGFTANLKIREQSASTNTFTLAVTSSGGDDGQITSTTGAVVRFDFSTGRWPTTGTFSGEVSLESSAGKIETAPDRQAFIVRGEL